MSKKDKKVKKRKKEDINKDYSWVIRGKQRKIIIRAINKPKIPTEIKEETDLSLNNVSDVLRELRKKDIVKLLNPKEKTGRLYQLTLRGIKIREKMLEE